MSRRFPFPGIPSGWYAVATSGELGRGKIRALHYFGRDLVLYRTGSGRAVLADAHCPHLGAHLADGAIDGEILRCPFHGFRFDPEGRCVGTPYGRGSPARARVRTWELREQDGLLLAWHEARDRRPEWTIPGLDLQGWSGIIHKRYEIASHPQETTENSIDFGHFTSVHSFRRAEMMRPVRVDGPLLESAYRITAALSGIGLPNRTVEASFDVEVRGLGYSLVTLNIPAFRVTCRLFLLPVPVDEESIHLRVACMAKHRSRILQRVLGRIVFAQLCAEVEEDVPLWTRKKYVDRPALARGDGPIAEYRNWARQFYPGEAGRE